MSLPNAERQVLQVEVPPRHECVILVPVGGAIEPACEAGLTELEKRGYPVWRVRGYAAIDQARNQMATDALAQGFRETFWIDSDIAFMPDDVDRVRCLGLPICSGICAKKAKRELAVHVLPGTEEIQFGEGGGLLELLYAGTGFLHVRRDVYEALVQKLELPHCNRKFGGNGMIPFFQPLVLTEQAACAVANPPRASLPCNPALEITRVFAPPALPASYQPPTPWYLAEDYAFCERVRRCGYAIWADTRIRLGHIGSCQYSWEEAGAAPTRYASFTYRLISEHRF